MSVPPDSLAIKKLLGEEAASLVEPEMLVGLGTGSTAHFFIEALARRCHEGLKIKAVATSNRSWHQAQALKIPLIEIDPLLQLDLVVDGADEIDPQRRLIKGGGGALLREKIISAMSRKRLIIAEESKCVEALGRFPLAVEVIGFAHRSTCSHMQQLGYKSQWRHTPEGVAFLTDEGHYIYDLQLPYPCLDPASIDMRLKNIPGVVETGFFLFPIDKILIGKRDGSLIEL